MNAETAIKYLVDEAMKIVGCHDPEDTELEIMHINEAARVIRDALQRVVGSVSKKDARKLLRAAPTVECSYCGSSGHNRRGCSKRKLETQEAGRPIARGSRVAR
jgi:hypothetical protein